MRIEELLREARWRAGVSQRAAAVLAGVAKSTWAGWESGATSPPGDRLVEVVAALGFELRFTGAPAPPVHGGGVAAHLSLSLTERARRAAGEYWDQLVAACEDQTRLLTGPAEVGVWLPHVVARGPLALPPAPDRPGLVRIAVPGGPECFVAVRSPAELVDAGLAAPWPTLPFAAELLVRHAPRDLEGRRLPAHRMPDEHRELRDLVHTLTWGARSRLPVDRLDGRAWRLDAPATLDALLETHGFRVRNQRRPT